MSAFDTSTHFDAREDKLPRWAQEKLVNMRRRVANAERDAREALLATDPAASSMVLNPHDDIPVGLGRDALVRAPLNPDSPRDEFVDLRVKTDSRGTFLEVCAGTSLALRPQASNVVLVFVNGR